MNRQTWESRHLPSPQVEKGCRFILFAVITAVGVVGFWGLSALITVALGGG